MWGSIKRLLRRGRSVMIVRVSEDPLKEVHDEMARRQSALMERLGFEEGDSIQNWLRLHEILDDHERRLKAVEEK